MRVLITGATGLVGQEIVRLCHQQDIDVNYLTTSKNKIEHTPRYKGFYWNPKQGEIDASCLQGVNSIIHLAGAPVAKKWTDSYKTEIIESRILSANILYTLLSKNKHDVKQFISSSGISIYPPSIKNNYTEDSDKVDNSFLGDVVVNWEAGADKFSRLGIRVAKIRCGIILDKNEGALPKLVKPIQLYAGAPLASGKQWQSWIHIYDIAKLYLYVLTHNLEGVYNGVAPEPVTNATLTQVIAKKLDKPLWLPNIPAAVLQAMLGEMATMVINGQKVSSEKIIAEGFKFKYPGIKAAIADLLE